MKKWKPEKHLIEGSGLWTGRVTGTMTLVPAGIFIIALVESIEFRKKKGRKNGWEVIF
jgi:hypothetical protein